MKRILVIADDFSGAAEIASLGVRYGLPARLERGVPANVGHGLTVIDTDTRLCAAAMVADVLGRVTRGICADDFDLLYKKTDSVLRGPVLAEIASLMRRFNRSAALLVPQNPSRGRTIQDACYRIDGIPLHSTAFADDPQHPAKTSNLTDLLGPPTRHAVRCATLQQGPLPAGITVGEASSTDEVRRWARCLRENSLAAGGADFFRMLLEARGCEEVFPLSTTPLAGTSLFVCGSASVNRDELIARAQRDQMLISAMPELIPGDDLTTRWADAAIAALDTRGKALLVICKPLDRSPGVSRRLEVEMANVVRRILALRRVDNLLLEGGATASAVSHAMGWNRFCVERELAPGVAHLRGDEARAMNIIIKPGSYRWPESVFHPVTSDAAAQRR